MPMWRWVCWYANVGVGPTMSERDRAATGPRGTSEAAGEGAPEGPAAEGEGEGGGPVPLDRKHLIPPYVM